MSRGSVVPLHPGCSAEKQSSHEMPDRLSLNLIFHIFKITGYSVCTAEGQWMASDTKNAKVPEKSAASTISTLTWVRNGMLSLRSMLVRLCLSAVQIFILVRIVISVSLTDGLNPAEICTILNGFTVGSIATVYIANSFGFRSRQCRLSALLLLYEQAFGFKSIQVRVFNKRLIQILVTLYFTSILFSSAISVFLLYFYNDKFRLWLYPFSETVGVAYIAACTSFIMGSSVITFLMNGNVYCLAIMTYLARKELLLVARETSELFPTLSSRSLMKAPETKCVADAPRVCWDEGTARFEDAVQASFSPESCRRDTALSGTSGMRPAISAFEERTLAGIYLNSNGVERKPRPDQDAVSVLNPPLSAAEKIEPGSSENHCLMNDTQLFCADLPKDASMPVHKSQSRKGLSLTLLDSVLENNKPESIVLTNSRLSNTTQKCHRLFSLSASKPSAEKPEENHLKTRATSEKRQFCSELEERFDYLREKHQTLCQIVEATHRCNFHLLPLMYALGMTSVCFVIMAFSSGSLPSSDLPVAAGVLMYFLWGMVIVTIMGCSIHEAAKAILDPLYFCSWSAFPPSLVQKIHFFFTRLTSGEVGYDVYGLFVVSRPTILMLGGTILTYTVVVVQFQMGTCTCSPAPANASAI